MDNRQKKFFDKGQAAGRSASMRRWYADFLTVTASLLNAPPPADILLFLYEHHLFARMPEEAPTILAAEGAELDRKLSGWACVSDWAAHWAQELKREHFRLLVGAGRPAAPPWSSCYRHGEELLFGEEALKDSDWYANFDLIPKQRGIPEDALTLELEFLSHLLVRDELAAAESFLSQRITPWLTRWRQDMEQAGGCFYPNIANLIKIAIDNLGAQIHETNRN